MAVAPRAPTYNVGGMTPFGFVQTPAYNQQNVPNLSNGEQALYEAQGSAVSYDDPNRGSFSNPPFIGIGSSNTAVPRWMQGENGQVKRILRGYMRRSEAYPFTPSGGTQWQRASNAQVHFMYNPESIERNYAALAQTQQTVSMDPANPNNADTAGVYIVAMSFPLIFDRQEEVATKPDHPGVLLDLGVLDMLLGGSAAAGTNPSAEAKAPNSTAALNPPPAETAGGGMIGDRGAGIPNPGGVTPGSANNPGWADAAAVPTGEPIPTTPSPTDTGSGGDQAIADGVSTESTQGNLSGKKFGGVTFDPGISITVVFSPNLTFQGTISSLSVHFEKFSHRMTPTRMSVNIGMYLNYFGEEPELVRLDPNTQAGTSAAQSNKNYDGTIPGTVPQGGTGPVDTGGSAQPGLLNDWNFVQRQKAMAWGAQWIGKVPYGVGGRCVGIEHDTLVPGQVQPPQMDCSSFCSRCLNVIGWSAALGIAKCDTSDNYITVGAKNNPKNWWTLDLNQFRTASNRWQLINKQLQSGDLLLRITGKTASGGRVEGHVVWVYKDAGGPDDGAHKWTILHTGGPTGKPVNTPTYSTSQIIDGAQGVKRYDWIARPMGKPS